LPLIGTGDWNDGMNRVGEQGKGESIWLAWFLYDSLTRFALLADGIGATPRATTWRRHARDLCQALEQDGWDGAWYRRAFFDDGTPLGSTQNTECQIDSIAQSWGVMSGAADPAHAAAAMAAVEQYLVKRADRLVLLFTPPFDKTTLEPGYVKGYPPGIRENGGQYTHGAIWSVIAYAMLGDGDKAGELFSLINPVNHALDSRAAHLYAVEPYVVAADIYSVAPHVGRGGWTWYTGSAAWLYRAGIERILGFQMEGNSLLLDPCIPQNWPGFEMVYQHATSRYEIVVENPNGVCRGVVHATLDGVTLPKARVALADDGATHRVKIILGNL
jgi:cyclic beta-1,2-glucan synthetase